MASKTLLCLAHMSGMEMKYIQDAFIDNWVVPLGPNVDAFETDLTEFVKSAPQSKMILDKNEITRWSSAIWAKDNPLTVVAVSAGTAAIHLALVALGITKGDEVICQSFTFCASCNPIKYLGASPVFVDSEKDTWNMDPELLRIAIKDRIVKTGHKPKAIILVYLYGMPAKISEIMAVANEYEIPVIEDAAEGLGSRYKGRICGTFGKFGILSFNGNKMITTSGGGAVICPDSSTRNTIIFYATQAREGYPYYQHEYIGYNYRLSNICAGIGRGQMTILDEHISHHRMLSKVYEKEFCKFDGISFHGNPSDDYDSNFWLNTIIIDSKIHVKNQEQAYNVKNSTVVGGVGAMTHKAKSIHTESEPNANVEAMRLALMEYGIETRPLWKPMHLQPLFSNSPAYLNGVSERLFHMGLCLPSGPWVSENDAVKIASIIKENIQIE